VLARVATAVGACRETGAPALRPPLRRAGVVCRAARQAGELALPSLWSQPYGHHLVAGPPPKPKRLPSLEKTPLLRERSTAAGSATGLDLKSQ
jgi:hypothetical protein